MEEIDSFIKKELKDRCSSLPRFEDGRIDYTHAHTCLVMTVFLEHNGYFLLMKRSDKVGSYTGKWNAIAGYIDEEKPLKQKVLEEVEEETKIKEEAISIISPGKVYQANDSKLGKTWIVHPVHVLLKERPNIVLDWEHTDYKWVTPKEFEKLDTVPHFGKSFENAIRE